MRLIAVIAFALFIVVAGSATHLAGGGAFGLTMVPGLEDLALKFGWIDEKAPERQTKGAQRRETANAKSEASANASLAALEDSAASVAPAAGQNTDNLGEQLAQATPAPAAQNADVIPPAALPPDTADPNANASADPTPGLIEVPGRAAARAADAPDLSPVFAMPVACRPGIDCLVSSFMDMAAGDSYRDYTCGALSYNEHKGTDIRLPSHIDMARGYPVVAAAPGTVIATRDGMPDVNFNLFGRAAVNDRGLGNVVAIDHGNGWRTYYGHMMRESVSVAVGDAVQAGQPLGMVGMSGLTEFPHLHFQLTRNGDPIDPYTGLGLEAGCGIEGQALWAPGALAALSYPRTLLLRLGFSDQVLNQAAVEYVLFKSDGIPADNRALILHAHLSGLLEGDRIEVRIFGPDNQLFAQAGVDIDKAAQSRILRVGKKDLEQPPETGLYRGEIRYFRQTPEGPQQLFETSQTVTVN